MTTLGETLFLKLASARHYNCVPIPCNDGRTPDYELSLGNHKVICEVKDFSNDQLSDLQNQSFAEGNPFVANFDPGKRLRRRIAKSVEQLMQYPDDPCAAVLFSQHTIPYEEDFVCRQHLPSIFLQFSFISAIIVIEAVKPELARKSLFDYSSFREAALQAAKELIQPTQLRARVYVNTHAKQRFPPVLFQNYPDMRIDIN